MRYQATEQFLIVFPRLLKFLETIQMLLLPDCDFRDLLPCMFILFAFFNYGEITVIDQYVYSSFIAWIIILRTGNIYCQAEMVQAMKDNELRRVSSQVSLESTGMHRHQ